VCEIEGESVCEREGRMLVIFTLYATYTIFWSHQVQINTIVHC
jgi:hypothetical protein